MSDRIEIGRRIRRLRLSKNMTQAQFAETLDISTNFISEIETGKKSISQDTLCRICKYYQISADYLLFGEEKTASPQCTLSDFLSHLSAEDIPIVIEYLEAALKIKKIEKKSLNHEV